MTTNHDANLTTEAIMAAGVKRISGLVEKHGITSPEVFSACERWGSILDDVNYPDSTCRWCGVKVKHNHAMGYWYHDDEDSTRACKTHAAAEAEPVKPFELKGSVTGRLSQGLSSGLVKPPLGNRPDLGPGPDATMQKLANDRERNFDNSFKSRLNDPNVNPRLY